MQDQSQNLEGSAITDSAVRLGQAGGDLIQGDGNSVTKIYLDLVGQKQLQWTERQGRILQKVQRDVETRLALTLNDEEVLIPLGLRDEGQAISRASLRLRRKLVTPQVQEPDLKQAILEVFCRADVRGKLLILGAPGAGKTTTLLTLTQELLAEARRTPGTTIPVIFELSAWKPAQTSLRDWLIAQLQDLYTLPPEEGGQWLQDELLLPLLDGLDELGMEPQRQCIAAINAFAQSYPRVVVCCRTQEYHEGGARLDSLPGQVCLEPLSDAQIEQYLRDLGLVALWQDLQTMAALQPMLAEDAEGNPGILRVPLLLSMAAVTYEGQAFTSRAALYAAYVEQRLHYETRAAERAPRGPQDGRQWAYATLAQEPSYQQTQRTLRWLARQLQQNHGVELLIERIQPRWLESPQARRRYRLIVGLILGLIGWLILGLIVGLILGLIFGLIAGLIVGLIFGLIFGLIGELSNIEPVEAFKISMSHFVRREILKSLKDWLIGGLIGGLILGLILGLIGWLIFGLILGLILGLIFGLIFGLIVGLIVGLIFGLIKGFQQELQLRSRPNQGIWNSLQSFLWTTLLSYPLGIVFTFGITELPSIVARGITQGKSSGVILSVIGAAFPQFLAPGIFGALLFGFLVGGGMACVQHLCLRWVLWQSGIAPRNLAQFLNYCVERRLLQRVGGRYRFLHRELLDHLAQSPPEAGLRP